MWAVRRVRPRMSCGRSARLRRPVAVGRGRLPGGAGRWSHHVPGGDGRGWAHDPAARLRCVGCAVHGGQTGRTRMQRRATPPGDPRCRRKPLRGRLRGLGGPGVGSAPRVSSQGLRWAYRASELSGVRTTAVLTPRARVAATTPPHPPKALRSRARQRNGANMATTVHPQHGKPRTGPRPHPVAVEHHRRGTRLADPRDMA